MFYFYFSNTLKDVVIEHSELSRIIIDIITDPRHEKTC